MKFKQILALVFAIALGYGAGQQGGKLWATDYPTGGGVGVHPVNLASDVTGELPHGSTSDDAANVHGLPASVNVLGNRDASGEFVARGTSGSITLGTSDLPSYAQSAAVTFGTAFSSAPRVVMTTEVTSGANALGGGIGNGSLTTTGFTGFASSNANAGSAIYHYIALGT
ncbi:hypothetical protein LCGC14_1621190 [marine sediment metagenome]|uniref:Uncharacterized protein n=1 Tax=marine sediment metagenome TaxID=412755 RepID=A0A0F9I5G1_9ZZZZ